MTYRGHETNESNVPPNGQTYYNSIVGSQERPKGSMRALLISLMQGRQKLFIEALQTNMSLTSQ